MPLYVLTHYGYVRVPIIATQMLLTRRYTIVSLLLPSSWQLYRHLCGSYKAIVASRDTFPFTTTVQTLCSYYACHSNIHYQGSIVRELLFLFLFTFHLSHPALPTALHTDTRLPQVAAPMPHLSVTDIKTPTSHPWRNTYHSILFSTATADVSAIVSL